MVQLPLETSKQSEETVPPGDGPAAWDSERDPEFCGQGSTGSDFFFFLMLIFKKVPEFGERTTVEMQAEMEMKQQVGKMSKNN